jgi:hypothetical protein
MIHPMYEYATAEHEGSATKFSLKSTPSTTGKEMMGDESSSSSSSTSVQSQPLQLDKKKFLPPGYILGDNDVYCGRGTLCFNHNGNRRFRLLVLANIQRYMFSTTKLEKSSIIYDIVDQIRASCNPGGGFVKKDNDTGLYYEVGDCLAVSCKPVPIFPLLSCW